MTSNKRICKNCCFYHHIAGFAGQCRIRSTHPQFPQREPTESCGEHKLVDDLVILRETGYTFRGRTIQISGTVDDIKHFDEFMKEEFLIINSPGPRKLKKLEDLFSEPR